MSTMPENRYIISAKARADMKSIAKYTIEKFGEGQSLKYAQGLKITLQELAQNPEMGKRYVAVKNLMLLNVFEGRRHPSWHQNGVLEALEARLGAGDVTLDP